MEGCLIANAQMSPFRISWNKPYNAKKNNDLFIGIYFQMLLLQDKERHLHAKEHCCRLTTRSIPGDKAAGGGRERAKVEVEEVEICISCFCFFVCFIIGFVSVFAT